MITPSTSTSSTKTLASVLSALLMGLALIAWSPSQARADQGLVASDPQSRSELDRAPGWVNLAFDSPVDTGIAKVLVLNADGKNVTTGDLIVEFNTITTQLVDDLPKGTYTVQYRADDSGSALGGSYQFSYGSGTFSPDAETTWVGVDEEPDVIKNPDPNATTTQQPAPKATTEAPPGEPRQPEYEPTAPETPGATSDSPPGPSAAEPGQDGPSEGGPPILPWILGGLVFLVLMGGATALYLRDRQNPRP